LGFITLFHAVLIVPVCSGFTVSAIRGCLLDSLLQSEHCNMARRCNRPQNIGRIFCVSGVPRNFVPGGSTNSVEDRGQRERGFGGR